MNEFFLSAPTAEDLGYEGYFDGQQLTIPDGTELECVVIDAFNGTPEGKATMECAINIAITSQGKFCGQKYRYMAKIYDNDATKRDRAFKNLSLLDYQAGLPLSNGRLSLSTENMCEHWIGKAYARVKMGLLVSEDDGREINFVRGFAFLPSKAVKQGGQQAQPQAQQQPQAQAQQDNDEIDF